MRGVYIEPIFDADRMPPAVPRVCVKISIFQARAGADAHERQGGEEETADQCPTSGGQGTHTQQLRQLRPRYKQE